MMWTNLRKLLNSRNPVSQARDFFEGTYRHNLYYSEYPIFRKLMRKHIKEQIEYRVRMMSADCYNNGQCTECGCETIALQMADRSCDGHCYPPMMTKRKWKKYLNHDLVFAKGGYWRASTADNSPQYYIETNTGYVYQDFSKVRNFKSKDGIYGGLPI